MPGQEGQRALGVQTARRGVRPLGAWEQTVRILLRMDFFICWQPVIFQAQKRSKKSYASVK